MVIRRITTRRRKRKGEHMKVYIAGKITGYPNYKEHFKRAEEHLKALGHTVMNPAILPEGFHWRDYMHICIPMLDVCEAIYLLNNWRDSDGAKIEYHTANMSNKIIMYEEEKQ